MISTVSNRRHIVVIGAGKTGRGFLARFAERSQARLSFIDQSESLVQKINEDCAYSIHYFGGNRMPTRIENVRAALTGTDEAIEWLSDAKFIFTAVGEQNLKHVAPYLHEAFKRKKLRSDFQPVYVVTGENGINPGKTLQDALIELGWKSEFTHVVESAIFCSTIELSGTRLDIQSEDYHELPFNSNILPENHRLPGMIPEPKFRELLQRKIYTYNCLSACIAYIGALKGYQLYADAANDAFIGKLIDLVVGPLNRALSSKLGVSRESQEEFTKQALQKFKDHNIRDDITRNARDVLRKLAPNERLIAPVSIIKEAEGTLHDLHPFALVVAAALHYEGAGEEKLREMLDKGGPAIVLRDISQLNENDLFYQEIVRLFELLFIAKSQIPNSVIQTMDSLIMG